MLAKFRGTDEATRFERLREELARITQAACGMGGDLGAVENSSPAADRQKRVALPPGRLRDAIGQRMALF
jgi:hypothetical protein